MNAVRVDEFPIGDTINDGAYRVTEHLHGHTTLMFCLGSGPDSNAGPPSHCISLIWAPERPPPSTLTSELAYSLEGVHELVHIGPFDVAGDDPRRNIYQRQHWALVERPLGGHWLPRWRSGKLGPQHALSLGLSIGRILANAHRAGVLLAGVRPEYIWADDRDGDVVATSLTGRHRRFFACVGGTSLVAPMIFQRSYQAPESERSPATDRSLVFTLSTMIAEWSMGQFPFPDAWVGGDRHSMRKGRHAPLDMPIRLAGLIGQGLVADPLERPPLQTFVDRLAALATAR